MMDQKQMRDARWQEAKCNRRIKEKGLKGEAFPLHIQCGCGKCGVFCIEKGNNETAHFDTPRQRDNEKSKADTETHAPSMAIEGEESWYVRWLRGDE